MPEYILSPFKKGWKAYKEGKTRDEAPNTMSPHNIKQWYRGYNSAEEASRDNNGQFTSTEKL